MSVPSALVRLLLTLVLGLGVGLSGCATIGGYFVVTDPEYRDHPQVPSKPPAINIWYPYELWKAQEQWARRVAAEVDLIPVTGVINRGLFCQMKLISVQDTPWGNWGGHTISFISLGIIPSFASSRATLVEYYLNNDGQLLKKFSYKIEYKTGVWVLFLPFLWVNFLTQDRNDAIGSTVENFVHDARIFLLATELAPGSKSQ